MSKVLKAEIGKGDSLWSAIKGKYDEIAGPKRPTHVLGFSIDYRVLAVSGAVPPLKVKSPTRNTVVLSIREGDPVFAAAAAFSAENGGQRNLSQVAIQIGAFRLSRDTAAIEAEMAAKAAESQ